MTPAERRAVEEVARRSAVRRASGDDQAGVFVDAEGRRVAIDVLTLPRHRTEDGAGAPARLRDDRVARRFVAELETMAGASVPAGRSVLFTLGAPIRLPTRALAALAAMLPERLRRAAGDRDEVVDVFHNRIRFRLQDAAAPWTKKAIAFVLSGDPGPGVLADAALALRAAVVARAEDVAGDAFVGQRWLVLAGQPCIADAATARRAFAHLAPPTTFARVLMLSGRRLDAIVG